MLRQHSQPQQKTGQALASSMLRNETSSMKDKSRDTLAVQQLRVERNVTEGSTRRLKPRSPRKNARRRARGHQEVREPAALQHRVLILRHARTTCAEMVKRRASDFVVYDAKTGEDITRSGARPRSSSRKRTRRASQNLLPIQFLRQLIGFYGGQMQSLGAKSYLELSLNAFTQSAGTHARAVRRRRSRSTAGLRHVPGSGAPEHGPVRPGHEDVHPLRLHAPRGRTMPRLARRPSGRPIPPPHAPCGGEDSLSELKAMRESDGRHATPDRATWPPAGARPYRP